MYRQYRDTKIHDYSFVKMGHGVVLICSYMEEKLPETYQEIVNHVYDILINAGFQPESFYIGICDELMTLERLNESVMKAKNANVVSQFMEYNNIAYSKIGVYKYIMSIVNNPILYHEVEDSIFVLQKYDASHDVNLLETVISYVKIMGIMPRHRKNYFSIAIRCGIAFEKQSSFLIYRRIQQMKKWQL